MMFKGSVHKLGEMVDGEGDVRARHAQVLKTANNLTTSHGINRRVAVMRPE